MTTFEEEEERERERESMWDGVLSEREVDAFLFKVLMVCREKERDGERSGPCDSIVKVKNFDLVSPVRALL